MFRVGKFYVQPNTNELAITRQMSLAKRLINANQLTFGSSRDKTPPSAIEKLSSTGKPPKKSKGGELDQTVTSGIQHWPRKIFSGIQPTGSLHLGNYLGAVRKWTELQKSRENVTLCIVDMHSITMPHNPPVLRENIFTMAATLLACGVDPAQSTLFVQSAVMEHSELNWILSSLSTMPRLAQLPQFKEKSRKVRDVPLGLYVYPVLQAADIMLYKATHVPVGSDQLQHIQLAQHLARSFNTRYGDMFPVCNPMIEENDGSRILSLRDTSKKMSKSDVNSKGTINLSDTPDQITEKIRKALTDFTSDISYNPSMRPGVSNLVNIHAHVTGNSIQNVVEEANRLDTAKYKERVSEAVIEHLRPIREKIEVSLTNRNELIYMLEMGAEKARQFAQQTMSEVKQRLGLGTHANMPASVFVAPLLPEHSKLTASQRLAKGVLHPDSNAHTQPHYDQRSEPGQITIPPAGGNAGQTATGDLDASAVPERPPMRRPVVPMQSMRVEKSRNVGPPRHIFKLDTFNVPKLGFRAPAVPSPFRSDYRERRSVPPKAGELGFTSLPHLSTVNSISGFKYGQNSNPSALASVTNQVNAAYKQQELVSSLANSAFYKAAASSFNNTNPNVVNVAANTVHNRINNSGSKATSSSSSSASSTSNSSNGSVSSNNTSSNITSITTVASSDSAEEEDESEHIGTAEQEEDNENNGVVQPEATKLEN